MNERNNIKLVNLDITDISAQKTDHQTKNCETNTGTKKLNPKLFAVDCKRSQNCSA